MRPFALGLVSGLLLAAMVIAASVSLVPWWMNRAPRIASGTTLILRLSGTIHEQEPAEFTMRLADRSWTTYRLWDTLRRATIDQRITALLLLPEHADAGWAKLGEIHAALLDFRKSGKPVYAFLRSPRSRDYYLATAAERISAPPGDFIDLKGLRAELWYARGMLEKFGVTPEIESIGKYKDGADILTRKSMSEETREVVSSMLDRRMQGLVDAISIGRGMGNDIVRRLLDDGPFIAAAAAAKRFLDAVEYEDQARASLAARLGQKELTALAASEYQSVSAKSFRASGPRIAVLAVEGDILRAPIPVVAEQVIAPSTFSKEVRHLTADAGIKAVILRLDSPGGDAIASDEMVRELAQLALKKPLIVSMSDVAASGGYALAAAGHVLVAAPESVTGSIGVFYGKLVFTGAYERLGLKKELLMRGHYADIDSEVRPLSPDARQKVQRMLREVYADFVAQVAHSRQRTADQVEQVAQGRVWLGSEAKANGLIDELGGIGKAIELAKRRAGLSLSDGVAIEVYPQRPGFFEVIEARLRPLIQSRTVPAAATASPLVWKRLAFDVSLQ